MPLHAHVPHLPREPGIRGRDRLEKLLFVPQVAVPESEHVGSGERKPGLLPPCPDGACIFGYGGGVDARLTDEHRVRHAEEGFSPPLSVEEAACGGHRHPLLDVKRPFEPVGGEVRFFPLLPFQPFCEFRNRGLPDLGAEGPDRYRNPSCHALVSLLASQPE